MNHKPNKILIVEDECIVASHIAETLKDLGYQITDMVTSGEMALQSVGKDQPDLILMDIVLGGEMTGTQTAEEINARIDVPVIFLTAYSDKKTVANAKAVGPFGYIVKPFKEKDLNSSIQVALEKHRQVKDLKHKEEWYKSSLKNLGEAVIAVDKNGDVSSINRLAESLTGMAENKGIGKPIRNIFSLDKENSGEGDPILKVIETGIPLDLSGKLTFSRGGDISAHINVTAVRDEKGNILGAVLVLHKINKTGDLENPVWHEMGKQANLDKEPGKNFHIANICPWCKKIFNEQRGRWDSIELYFKDSKPDLEFSHCMCSECAGGLGLFDPEKTR